MEKSLLTAWVGPSGGWDGVSGDLQVGAKGVSQVDGVSEPPAGSVVLWVEGSEKGQ